MARNKPSTKGSTPAAALDLLDARVDTKLLNPKAA
jgi:hypothetical protein